MTVALSQGVMQSAGWLDRLCRAQVFKHLTRLTDGCIEWIEDGDEQIFGDAHAELRVRLTVTDHRFYQKLALEGSVGAGEAYMDGWWHSDHLTALVQIFARNMRLLDQLESGLARVSKPALKLLSWRQRNTLEQARRNIAAHYDLGNQFYQLMLDASMMYSSAVYPTADSTLEQAQQHKLKLLCERLQLQPGDHLLEIGTGWGSLAIYAAQHYGCKVTTTTISAEQHQFAAQRIKQLGLGQQITLLQQDYRLLTGQYDKLVSVEMIEAVGEQYLDGYFAKCASLLKPDGLMVLQAITIADQRFEHYKSEVDFIQKFIFPGGFLPSVHRMAQAMMQHTDLVMRQLTDIGFDYARTLADWRCRFEQQLPAIRQLGYDERFIRMWRFYLCYCEGGFLERATSTVQLVMSKPNCRLPS
jgi:cyclopropane-fatty-acyl-phospholipid synthase